MCFICNDTGSYKGGICLICDAYKTRRIVRKVIDERLEEVALSPWNKSADVSPPKDGTEFFAVYERDKIPYAMFYEKGKWWPVAQDDFTEGFIIVPKYWMPIHELPKG